MANDGSYPPPAFRFSVVFRATLGLTDTSFQEVSGIGSEMETEDVAEGGENRFVHRLPIRVKHPKLVLKRGIAQQRSPIVKWCMRTFDFDAEGFIEPMNLMVLLLDENGMPTRSWEIADAYPVNWEVEAFNSTKNEVAIEKLELSYTYSKRVG